MRAKTKWGDPADGGMSRTAPSLGDGEPDNAVPLWCLFNYSRLGSILSRERVAKPFLLFPRALRALRGNRPSGGRRSGLFPTAGTRHRPLEQNRFSRLGKRLHRPLLIRHEQRNQVRGENFAVSPVRESL